MRSYKTNPSARNFCQCRGGATNVQEPVGLLKPTGDVLLARYSRKVELSARFVIGSIEEAGIVLSSYATFPPFLIADVSQKTLPFILGKCLPVFHDLIISFHVFLSLGFAATRFAGVFTGRFGSFVDVLTGVLTGRLERIWRSARDVSGTHSFERLFWPGGHIFSQRFVLWSLMCPLLHAFSRRPVFVEYSYFFRSAFISSVCITTLDFVAAKWHVVQFVPVAGNFMTTLPAPGVNTTPRAV